MSFFFFFLWGMGLYHMIFNVCLTIFSSMRFRTDSQVSSRKRPSQRLRSMRPWRAWRGCRRRARALDSETLRFRSRVIFMGFHGDFTNTRVFFLKPIWWFSWDLRWFNHQHHFRISINGGTPKSSIYRWIFPYFPLWTIHFGVPPSMDPPPNGVFFKLWWSSGVYGNSNAEKRRVSSPTLWGF